MTKLTKTESELSAISWLNQVAFCRDIAVAGTGIEGNSPCGTRYIGRILYHYEHAAKKLDNFRKAGRAGDRVWIEAPNEADRAEYKRRVRALFESRGMAIPAAVRA